MVSKHITGVIQHKQDVASLMGIVATELFRRAANHDNSKFSSQECDIFEEMTPLLETLSYGSEEYKQILARMQPALAHHYRENNHHPEYYENGINGMSLLDLIEMVCDWMAATKRVKDGDIVASLKINKKRFGIDDQLAQVIENTVQVLQNHIPSHPTHTRPDPNTLYPDVFF